MTSPFGYVCFGLSAGKLARLAALACLALALCGLSGCVSAEQYKRLEAAFNESQDRLAQADADLAKARQTIEELRAEIAKLNGLIDANSSGVGALRRERDLLASRLAELEDKYNELLKLSQTVIVPPSISNLLRDLAAQYPDLMEFDERLGMIRLKTDLTFDAGSTEVNAKGKEVLAKLAGILNNPEIERHEIQVLGHTDDIPINPGGALAQRNPDNWTLSTNRAWAVLRILRDDGVRKDRGQAAGWGDQRPIVPNEPGQRGNRLNRRVEIFIRPTTVPEGIVVSSGAARAAAAPSSPNPTAPTRTPGGVPLPRP